jgi:hypothetical protein
MRGCFAPQLSLSIEISGSCFLFFALGASAVDNELFTNNLGSFRLLDPGKWLLGQA